VAPTLRANLISSKLFNKVGATLIAAPERANFVFRGSVIVHTTDQSHGLWAVTNLHSSDNRGMAMALTDRNVSSGKASAGELLHRRMGHANYDGLIKLTKSGRVSNLGCTAADLLAAKVKGPCFGLTRTEYMGDLLPYFSDKGIEKQMTTRSSPHTNGRAEIRNRTLLGGVRANLADSGLPSELWGEAARASNYTRNRAYSSVLNDTPYRLFTGEEPNLSKIRVFGSPTWVYGFPKNKLAPLAIKGVFVGYEPGTPVYRIYHPESGKITVEREVRIIEGDRAATSIPYRGLFEEEDGERCFVCHSPDSAYPSVMLLCDGCKPDGTPCGNGYHLSCLKPALDSVPEGDWLCPGCTENEDDCMPDLVNASDDDSDDDDPPQKQSSGGQAVVQQPAASSSPSPSPPSSPPSPAPPVQPVPSPPGSSPPSPMHALAPQAAKTTRSGKSYGSQLSGVMSFIAKNDPDPISLKEAQSREDWPLWEEAIHEEYASLVEKLTWNKARIPSGQRLLPVKWVFKRKYDEHGNLERYKARLASQVWYEEILSSLTNLGFVPSVADPCLFIRPAKSRSDYVYLLLYVDDMLVIGRTGSVREVVGQVTKVYECRDLGCAKQFLGMAITRDRGSRTILLTQAELTKQLLLKFNLSECRTRDVPLSVGEILRKDSDNLLGTSQFAELVGSLLYLSNCTRPDITYAVNKLSRYMSCSTPQHMQAALSVLRYLSGTAGLGLLYGPSADGSKPVKGYGDADYAGCVDTRRSTTGFVVTYNGTAVSWKSTTQQTVSRSTTEAEYQASDAVIGEAQWMIQLFPELGIPLRPMLIYSDSQGALAVLKNPGGSSRSKHIDVLHHVARERVMRKDVLMEYIPTARMVADILTKALPKVKFEWCRKHMGMI
ncbi:hypothetical protein FOA52_009541, partial [Chlamydomonas sp. UWO 241]